MSLEHLNAVFRVLMTAVNQQFIHILILRAWNQADSVKAIVAVDKADFPMAMRFAHRIVALGAIPRLIPDNGSYTEHLPAPGNSLASILAVELALERRLGMALERASAGLAADPESHRLLEEAALPRAQYVDWLRSQLSARGPDPAVPGHATTADQTLDVFLAQLIALIEQSFVHAFVLWQRGERQAADAAWATSGAAMMQADKIVTHLARHGAVPRSTIDAVRKIEAPAPAADPATALARDTAMAATCGILARQAAARIDDAVLAAFLREMAVYYEDLRHWRPDRPHPATDRLEAFRSFGRMLERYVPAATMVDHR